MTSSKTITTATTTIIINFSLFFSDGDTLTVHVLDSLVPLSHTLAKVVEVKTGNRDFARYHGMYGGASVTDHEQVLGVGKHLRREKEIGGREQKRQQHATQTIT